MTVEGPKLLTARYVPQPDRPVVARAREQALISAEGDAPDATGVPADAISGIGGAFAFLLGMRHRERTGKGLLIELATAENLVPLLGEFVMDYTPQLKQRALEILKNFRLGGLYVPPLPYPHRSASPGGS